MTNITIVQRPINLHITTEQPSLTISPVGLQGPKGDKGDSGSDFGVFDFVETFEGALT